MNTPLDLDKVAGVGWQERARKAYTEYDARERNGQNTTILEDELAWAVFAQGQVILALENVIASLEEQIKGLDKHLDDLIKNYGLGEG